MVVLNDGDNYVSIQNPTSGEEWDLNRWSFDNYTLFRYEAKSDGDVKFSIYTDVGQSSLFGGVSSYGNIYASTAYFDSTRALFFDDNVKAGQIFYIGVRGYNDNVIGSCKINVEFTSACSLGHHTMTPVAEVLAICKTNGNVAHYHCSKCGFDYADEDGTERIVDVVTGSLGHDYDSEGNCQREGCGYKVVELNRGDNKVNVQNITNSNKWSIEKTNPRHYNLLKYIAKSDDEITITGVGNKQIFAVLFDSNMSYITETTGNWETIEDFIIPINEVKTNNVYYIGLRGNWEAVIGDYTINIDAPCASGQHILTQVTGEPATCNTDGTMTHWHCSSCGRNYADAGCTEKIKDVVIPALGHDIDDDGRCKHEGCDVAYVILHDGDNDVNVLTPTSVDEWYENRLDVKNFVLCHYKVESDGDLEIRINTDNGHASLFCDQNLVPLVGDLWSDTQYSYFVQQNVKAGEVYYIGVRGYGDNVINSCNINMHLIPACAQGNHTMTYTAAAFPTCTTDGNVEYYHCSKCNFNYADETGTKRILDPTFYSLGHNYDSEGNCQREGCGYKAVELSRGDNKVNIHSITFDDIWYYDKYSPRHYSLMKYTVKADGDITIKSVGGSYVYGIVFDSNMQYIDAKYNHSDFELNITGAHAGDVYYIGARGVYGYDINNGYIINIEAPLPTECAPNQHTMTHVTGIPVTCTNDGTVEHWYCSACDRYYANAEGTQEIAEIVIKALGHDICTDGSCLREGCDYSLPELQIGGNAVNILTPTYGNDWNSSKEESRHYTLFKYTVKADGDVIIRSVGGLDTYGALYNSNWECLAVQDANEDNYYDFKLVIENAKAGDVYFIGARGYGNTLIGDYTINVFENNGSMTATGQILVGKTMIDLEYPESVSNFNAANTGKMNISQTEIGGKPAVVLTLNGVEINNDPDYYVTLGAEISAPLIVNVLGENTINVKNLDQGRGAGLSVSGDLILAGSGTLNINIGDPSDEAFGYGIDAIRVISIDDKVADILKEIDGTEIPDEYTFSGTINITGELNNCLGIITEDDGMFLSGGNYNINLNGGIGIVSVGKTALLNNNVKIKAGGESTGIYLIKPDEETSSTYGNWMDWLRLDNDLTIQGGNLEIDAESSVVYDGFEGQPSLFVQPQRDGDIMVVETGSSKETAQKVDINTTNLLDVAGSYLHIYEQSYEEYIATGIGSNLKQNADDEKMYNIMGQRVGKNTKGIVIVNGRAVVRK